MTSSIPHCVAEDGETPAPPVAQTRPKVLSNHGTQRIDPYYWLRDRENQQVIDYLNAENAWTDAAFEEQKPLEAELFAELKGRIRPDDTSVPYTDRGYVYYTRYEDGKQYPIYCRKAETSAADDHSATEQVMLDVNRLAEGQSFCSVVGLRVSPDSQRLAFGVDFTGRRKYRLMFKDLSTGELLDDQVENVTGSCVWAQDSQTVFFTRKDPQTLRAYLVVRHQLLTPAADDVVVFEETDEEFSCGVRTSRSRDYIFIVSRQTLTTEVRYLPANQPTADFQVFLPRRAGHEYSVDHLQDTFYIRSNDQAANFRLFTASTDRHARADWTERIAH
ncbi:MAG: hypothetical protein NXI04_18020, partial [Planctomycetaceae bacterium]|nr:hypothetical protein [Planctomycetaceae bacterium]